MTVARESKGIRLLRADPIQKSIQTPPPPTVVQTINDKGELVHEIVENQLLNPNPIVNRKQFEIPKREKLQSILNNETPQKISKENPQLLHICFPNEQYTEAVNRRRSQNKKQIIPVLVQRSLNIHPKRREGKKPDTRIIMQLHEPSKEQQTIIKSDYKLDHSGVDFNMRIFQLNYTMDKSDFMELQKLIMEKESQKIIWSENLDNTESKKIGKLKSTFHDIIWTGNLLDGPDWRIKRKLKKESKKSSTSERFQQYTKQVTDWTINEIRGKYGQ